MPRMRRTILAQPALVGALLVAAGGMTSGATGCASEPAGEGRASGDDASSPESEAADATGTPTPDTGGGEAEAEQDAEVLESETDGVGGKEDVDVDAVETGELYVPGDPVTKAPEDYGLIKPPIDPPSPDELVNHGMAGYAVVAVYAEPNMESKKLGFLRLGARMKVTERKGKDGCPKGWYGLPEGGFACASKGLVVDADRAPYLHAEPPPPKLDEPMPYEWAYVRKWNSPQWWRVPNTGELARAEAERKVREAERTGEPLEPDPPPKPKPKPKPKPAPKAEAGDEGGDLADLPPPPKPEGDGGEADPPKEEPKADPPKEEPKADPPKEEPKADPPAGEGDGGTVEAGDDGGDPTPEPAKPEETEPAEPPPPLPLNPSHPWLEKGYFISLAKSVREKGRSFWQTARGGFVAQSDAYKYTPKDFQGVALTDEITFPVGFAMQKETRLYELGDDNKARRKKSVERRTFLNFTEETEIGGTAYMVIDDGLLVKKDDVRIPELRPRPKGIKEYERWVDVSLAQPLLVAYEGNRPVYVTLVSTGRKGSEEEPFETPPGRYRIYSKQVTSNMDGSTATDGNYAIQDVPWVMYFEGSYALHGAFWHRSFGYVRSHGCVNLGPSDARWLFFWTTPFLPEGWHGVHATDDSPGTTVIVRE